MRRDAIVLGAQFYHNIMQVICNKAVSSSRGLGALDTAVLVAC